jgi:tetratricopeptide (TPR) repeat protein
MTLSGTPASMETSTSQMEETEWKSSDVPYIDYLKKSQELFSRENYKKALTRYLTILETYPDDVNALFYSGLCYYNLKQYSDASLQFFGCLSSKYNNFNEEAEWFIAKSYQAEGETSKAASIFEMIVEKDGYYAGQAKEQLRK